jgi:hypothetical protein
MTQIQEIPDGVKLVDKTNLPDIYYIILDGYARGDVLQELYNYDNTSFIQSLNTRGFKVASQSQVNYIQTILSLASSLNMEYLPGKPARQPNKGWLMGLIYQSRTRTYVEQLGYQFVSFSTAYPPTDISNADYYFNPPNEGKSHDLEALLLINTVLNPFTDNGWIKVPITKYHAGQERVIHIFTSLERTVPVVEGPKFVFAHVIAPHPPFIFDQNGPVTPEKALILQGAKDFEGRIDEYLYEYISDLKYVNQRVIQSIDGIQANSKIPPIIILQADHGPDAYLDWNSLESCLKERFSIFNAFYLPGQESNIIPDDITPVNTFRILFNSYFGTQFEILPNYHYFATWENTFPFIEVSNISQASCEIP